MGIIGSLVLIVFASGCISSSTNESITFSDGVMSFNYPGSFTNTSQSEDENSNSSMQDIGKFGNGNLFNMQVIMVGKNKTEISAKEIRDKSISRVKNLSLGDVVSTTSETNPNGVVIERSIYTQKGSYFGVLIYNDMFFEINGVVYAISVYGPDSNKQQITDTTNIVFQSIK